VPREGCRCSSAAFYTLKVATSSCSVAAVPASCWAEAAISWADAQRALVGPLNVVDHDDRDALGLEPTEQLEQPPPASRVVLPIPGAPTAASRHNDAWC